MAEVNKVPADRMRTFIRVASALPNIPLLEGVRMLIAGEIKLVAETQADTATEPSKSRLILPPGV
jgi:hypothetical protein